MNNFDNVAPMQFILTTTGRSLYSSKIRPIQFVEGEVIGGRHHIDPLPFERRIDGDEQVVVGIGELIERRQTLFGTQVEVFHAGLFQIECRFEIDGLPRLRIGVDLVDFLVRSGYGDFSLARGRLNGLTVELTRWDDPCEHREEHDQHERDGVHMGKLEMESALGLLLFGIRHS